MSSDYKLVNGNSSITALDKMIYTAKVMAQTLGMDHQYVYNNLFVRYGKSGSVSDLLNKFREENQKFAGDFNGTSKMIFTAFIYACQFNGTELMFSVDPNTLAQRLAAVQYYYDKLYVSFKRALPHTITNIPHLDRVKEVKMSVGDNFEFDQPYELEEGDSVTFDGWAEYESSIDGGSVKLKDPGDTGEVKDEKYLKISLSKNDKVNSHPGLTEWLGEPPEGATSVDGTVTNINANNSSMNLKLNYTERNINKSDNTDIEFTGGYGYKGFTSDRLYKYYIYTDWDRSLYTNGLISPIPYAPTYLVDGQSIYTIVKHNGEYYQVQLGKPASNYIGFSNTYYPGEYLVYGGKYYRVNNEFNSFSSDDLASIEPNCTLISNYQEISYDSLWEDSEVVIEADTIVRYIDGSYRYFANKTTLPITNYSIPILGTSIELKSITYPGRCNNIIDLGRSSNYDNSVTWSGHESIILFNKLEDFGLSTLTSEQVSELSRGTKTYSGGSLEPVNNYQDRYTDIYLNSIWSWGGKSYIVDAYGDYWDPETEEYLDLNQYIVPILNDNFSYSESYMDDMGYKYVGSLNTSPPIYCEKYEGWEGTRYIINESDLENYKSFISSKL